MPRGFDSGLTAEYAMVALSKRGTANELSSVCKFGLKLIKKLKTPQNWDFPSGLLLAIQFASRYVGTNTADELLAIFESRKSSIMWRVEIDWVEQNWGLPDLDLALFKP